MLQRLDVFHLVNLRSMIFISKITERVTNNSVFCKMAINASNDAELRAVFDKYNCNSSWHHGRLKYMVYKAFELVANVAKETSTTV